ncbi:hypothetical protein D7030_05020 [Flavobacteriaceae bacterium AU392]|nr:hypothetical protein D1817_11495 [Flavobacteriaceae bacterium]RKM86038.1 hypothetical protein D7030_05020 [Flavobacteriaceae bacterium AU392]
MLLNQYLIKLNNNHRPIVFNIILWFGSFIILLFLFTKGNAPIKIDYIYTSAFLATLIIPVLINLYILIPKFLKKEKYILFVILFLLNLLVFNQLHIYFFNPLLDIIFPNYFFISYHSNTKLIIIFSVFLIGTALIKLSEDWFYFNQNENRLLRTQNLQIQTQLASLRSQINPHFLFNSLNVIYALALEKKEETKDAIVQLSDILRYVIYDSNTERVLLKEELLLLKNYIAFQKFRQQSTEHIKLNYNIENDTYRIYPMLILPLVENSFKHGIKGDTKNTFININIIQNGNQFNLTIENNRSESELDKIDEHSGLGIENIKQNLEIVYPNTHTFEIKETNNTFTVILNLETIEN